MTSTRRDIVIVLLMICITAQSQIARRRNATWIGPRVAGSTTARFKGSCFADQLASPSLRRKKQLALGKVVMLRDVNVQVEFSIAIEISGPNQIPVWIIATNIKRVEHLL